jgi:hypothetical protein
VDFSQSKEILMATKIEQKWGFYGGNEVLFDGRGFIIKMDYGSEVYLEYSEAQSLASLLNKKIFKEKVKGNK